MIAMLFLLSPFRGLLNNESYVDAKTDSLELFEDSKDGFISSKDSVIANESSEDITMYGIKNIGFIKNENTSKVDFSIGSQGMTGGQYWGIYFSSNNKPVLFGEADVSEELKKGPYDNSYYYRELNGNNFYATERIEEGWYFYYMDFDGNKYGLNW